jgi:penicillin amidase
VLADRDGHIGLQTSGWFPLRPPGQSGLTPVPAWDTRNHWQGWVHPELLPRIYDPPEGFIASANENVNEPTGPQLCTMPLPDYRKRRIVQRLRELPQATVADMQQLQYDVTSTQAAELLGVFLPELPDGTLRRRLAAWDFRYAPESREATLFLNLYRSVLLEIFGHEEGIGWRRMLYLCSRLGFSVMVLTAIDRLLVERDSLWWAGRDKGELIRRAAARAAREPDRPWAKTNAFRFTNRFLDHRAGRVLGFHTGEMPMPGCHATPFQGHLLRTATRETTFAPSYHFVTDLASDEAWTNLPGGPRESRFSPFYKSDIRLWRSGRYKKLEGRSQK